MCQSQGLYIKCIILCSHGKNLTDFSVTLMKSSFYDALGMVQWFPSCPHRPQLTIWGLLSAQQPAPHLKVADLARSRPSPLRPPGSGHSQGHCQQPDQHPQTTASQLFQ